MRVTWHGHSFFHVETRDASILLDPFVENGRTRRRVADFDPDAVLITHGHDDHVGSVLEFPRARIVANWEIGKWLAARGARNVTTMNVGGTVEPVDGVRVTMTWATHSSGIDAAQTDGVVPYGGNPCGYVLDDGETRLYVAGDTGLFGDMRAVVRDVHRPHAAIVPIGDVYTMGPEHAALAVEWLGVGVALPCHYGTFPVLDVDPQRFVRAVGGKARVEVPPVDGGVVLRGARVEAAASAR